MLQICHTSGTETTTTARTNRNPLHATSSSDDPPTNRWNLFQQRYGGYNLQHKEFPVLYKWDQRVELERTATDAEVIKQFLAVHRPTTTTEATTHDDEWDVLPNIQ